MSDWQTFGALLGAALALSALVYLLVVLWPQRIPKDQSVQGIRRRIEHEDTDEPPE